MNVFFKTNYEVIDNNQATKKQLKKMVKEIESGAIPLSKLEPYLSSPTGDKNFDRRVGIYYHGRMKSSVHNIRNLGILYLNGLSPAPKNRERSLKYITTAAYKNDRVAMRILGDFYKDGISTLRPCRATSETWYKKAADLGDEKAKKQLKALRPSESFGYRNPRYVAARTLFKRGS